MTQNQTGLEVVDVVANRRGVPESLVARFGVKIGLKGGVIRIDGFTLMRRKSDGAVFVSPPSFPDGTYASGNPRYARPVVIENEELRVAIHSLAERQLQEYGDASG